VCVRSTAADCVCVCCYQLKLWRGSLLKLMRSLMKGLQGHSKPLSLQPPLISALPLFKLPHPPTVGTCTCGSLHHHPISHPPTLHTHTQTLRVFTGLTSQQDCKYAIGQRFACDAYRPKYVHARRSALACSQPAINILAISESSP